MITLAHLSSGYLVYISAAHSVRVENGMLFIAAILGSLAPDLDGLFGGDINTHRNTVFHAPLFWLGLFAVSLTATSMLRPELTVAVAAFFAGTSIHLVLDWISARTSGVRIFYPFLKKAYSLYSTEPEKGAVPIFPDKKTFKKWVEFWEFYLQKKPLVLTECVITISPVILYFLLR